MTSRIAIDAKAAAARQVLVAEDNPDIAELIEATLTELRGWDVSVVRDGEAALIDAAECAPDIVILDALMPGLGGIETCRRLKASRWGRDITVVILTALAQEQMRDQAMRAGADLFLTKPFAPRVLCDELDMAFRTTHAPDRNRSRDPRSSAVGDRVSLAVAGRLS